VAGISVSAAPAIDMNALASAAIVVAESTPPVRSITTINPISS
jgi:hypothetical protein